MKIKLYDHQKTALEKTKNFNRVAYYHDMGLGKTFTGSEKLMSFGTDINLVVCQKSKIDDWINHFKTYYPDHIIYDLTKPKDYKLFINNFIPPGIAVINYDLVWRKPELLHLNNFSMLLDESSLIQNDKAKRSKFILKLHPKNVILLSGTPVGGKYENLYTQLELLGWNITKTAYWNKYIRYEMKSFGGCYPFKHVIGYRNVDDLKKQLVLHGADFLNTNEVFDLPEQTFITVNVPRSADYKIFVKHKLLIMDDLKFVGDNPLKKLLYCRMLCGQHSKEKLAAFKDLIDSTAGRIVVFYNFNSELAEMLKLVKDRGIAIVNGQQKNLAPYYNIDDTITFVQYRAGAMGMNLQKANHVIYFSLPLSSELYEQSKKRIHRIGQDKPCFYYRLIVKNSVEENILKTLNLRQDYTAELFRKEDKENGEM